MRSAHVHQGSRLQTGAMLRAVLLQGRCHQSGRAWEPCHLSTSLATTCRARFPPSKWHSSASACPAQCPIESTTNSPVSAYSNPQGKIPHAMHTYALRSSHAHQPLPQTGHLTFIQKEYEVMARSMISHAESELKILSGAGGAAMVSSRGHTCRSCIWTATSSMVACQRHGAP